MARMKSSLESGFVRNDEIVQKWCKKKAGVWIYYGTSELLYFNQAFGGG
jgi:hypothetical protein